MYTECGLVQKKMCGIRGERGRWLYRDGKRREREEMSHDKPNQNIAHLGSLFLILFKYFYRKDGFFSETHLKTLTLYYFC